MARIDKHLLILILSFLVSIKEVSSLLDILAGLNFHHLNISEKCNAEIQYFSEAFYNREPWALKMLDSSGRIQMGFVWGNPMMIGSPVQCEMLNNPFKLAILVEPFLDRYVNVTEIGSPFKVEYKVTYAEQLAQLQVQIIKFSTDILCIGLCLPESCSISETERIVTKLLHSNEFLNKTVLDKPPKVLHSKNLSLRRNFLKDPVVITLITLLVTLVILGALSTFILLKFPNARYAQFYECFSVPASAQTILSVKQQEGSIQCLHGLRSLSMIWIMIIHIMIFYMNTLTNPQFVAREFSKPGSPHGISSTSTVDIFHCISGLLLTYNILINAPNFKEKNFSSAVNIFIKRLFRVSTAYYLIFLINFVSDMYISDISQFSDYFGRESICRQQWWHNLLYINSIFYPATDICMVWTWFLAVDMQAFVIILVLLFLGLVWKRLSIAIFVGLFAASSSYVGYSAYYSPFNMAELTMIAHCMKFYSTLQSKLHVYLVGVLAGWFLVHINKKIILSQTKILVLWIISIVLIFAPILRRTSTSIGLIERVIYMTFSRVTFASGLMILVIMCTMGYGGFLNRFLSANIFKIMSRLSFTFYLLHPVIIKYVAMAGNTMIEINGLTLIIMSSGYLIIMLIVTFIFMLIFETPLIKLIKLGLKENDVKSKNNYTKLKIK